VKLTERPGRQDMWDLTVEVDHNFYVDFGAGAVLVHNQSGVPVPGAGCGTRNINFRPGAADPNWGLTSQHIQKHLFGEGGHALKQIDPAGNPDQWVGYIQDLAGRPATANLSNGVQDVIGTFPKAGGGGTFQLGIRIAPKGDGTFDLVTLLTKQ
jgi:hypothetical protein